VLVFKEGGKPENPRRKKKKPWSKARTNNKVNPGHIGGRQEHSQLHLLPATQFNNQTTTTKMIEISWTHTQS